MNIALSIVLVLIVGALARAFHRTERDYQNSLKRRRDPKQLEGILNEMTRAIDRAGDWEQVEAMRAALHKSLHRIEFHRRFVRRREVPNAGKAISDKVSATRLARRYGTTPMEIQARLVRLGYIEVRNGWHYFTDKGRAAGGEWHQRPSSNGDDGHMVWPADLELSDPAWATAD